MKRSQFLRLAASTAAVPLLASCSSTPPTGQRSTGAAVEGDIEPRPISWLLSRPANGAVIEVMNRIADEYSENHPGFSLQLITTPDRPSYLQKFVTLATANQLPELFDTDATPFAQKLVDQDRLIDVEDLLSSFGILEKYRPAALDYQRFDDGSLRMIPLEFGLEVFWYNKSLFEAAGVEIPTTLEEMPRLCATLAASGTTPIAVSGQDAWPLERYLAFYPFRMAGIEYITSLTQGAADFADDPGMRAATWMQDLGESGAFQPGFSSVGYADAQNLFTSGGAAMYNIGTWELPNLATTELPEQMHEDISYFTLPVTEHSVTNRNEYVAPSGIGVAVNAETYDPLVRDFLEFALNRYPELYAQSGILGPTRVEPVIPDNALPIYSEAIAEAENLGEATLMPWDTQLDPTTNTRLQQELVLLVQGDVSVEDFITTMDATLDSNTQLS